MENHSSFSFQAPGFYQKLGYQIVGRLDGYPPGEPFSWLRTDLNEHEPAAR